MRLIKKRDALANMRWLGKGIIANNIASKATWASKAYNFTVSKFAEQRRTIGCLDHIRHMASRRNIRNPDRHFVFEHIKNFPDQYARIQRHCFARLKIYLTTSGIGDKIKELDQFLALVIGARDVMTTAKIKPFQIIDMMFDIRRDRFPCPVKRFKILLAKRMEMQTVYRTKMLFGQLVNRKPQPAMRLARVIFWYFALGMERIDAKADIKLLAAIAKGKYFCP